MSAGEIVYRMGQSLEARRRRAFSGRTAVPLDTTLATADRLRAVAASGPTRTIRFFGVSLDYPSAAPLDWSRDYKNGVSAPSRFYGDVDYRDESEVGDSKYTWELNRHQFLVPWALEFQRSGDETAAAAVVSVILDWIGKNPRYVGINWISSLEHALRILGWGICLDLCRSSKSASEARPLIAQAVAEKARFIRETLSLHSSANNHLMGELVGLLAVGAFFPEAHGSADHAAFAQQRIVAEAARQNHADGVNREQAIYYHHYVAEYLLVAESLLGRVGAALAPHVSGLTHRMLTFIDAMTDDHGQPFEIGDRDDGSVTGLNLGTGVSVYESLLWTAAARFADADAGAHAARIARNAGRQPAVDPRTAYWYPDAVARMGSDERRSRRFFFQEGGYFLSSHEGWNLLFKGGPFGYPSIAAHSHCDQLGVLLRRGGRDVLTDGGTCVYHTNERWRRYFKGTTAHNTVRVDGVDQAEYAGAFLWATHADARLEVGEPGANADDFTVRGSHDGYLRLPDPVTHERRVELRSGVGYRITDDLRGEQPHAFELVWNVGGDFDLAPAERSPEGVLAWDVRRGGATECRLVVPSPGGVPGLYRGDEHRPAGFESRSYLEKTPCWQVVVTARAARWRCVTYVLFGPGPADEDALSLERRWS